MYRYAFRPRLVPAYVFRGMPFAWQCATCGKMFSLNLEEAKNIPAVPPPGHIQHEFNTHNCELHVVAKFGGRLPDPMD